jgi:hypothetical protein
MNDARPDDADRPDDPGHPDHPGRADEPGRPDEPDQPGPADDDRHAGSATDEPGDVEDARSDRHGDPAPQGGVTGARGEGDPRPASAALAAVGRTAPPPPPRRTGVFVDPEELRTHVGALLRSILGGYEVDAFGNFTFLHEGARVFVTIGGSPIGPHVGVFCVTNVDVDLTPELGMFLLTTNHTLGFGSFSYDPANRAVWLRHTLLGTTLDVPELQAAVAAVSTTAAALDDRIKERFGGRRFQDAPSEMQRRMEPPEPTEPPRPNAGGYL